MIERNLDFFKLTNDAYAHTKTTSIAIQRVVHINKSHLLPIIAIDYLFLVAQLSIIQSLINMADGKFPYAIAMIVFIWIVLIVVYLILRWRQRPRAMYIIPRVFVLCSPRTVQFHYELLLRVGLPSYDFNPDKHDIDVTALGQQNNEVVPMTRLNTKTLLDEPLITTLSIIVYRLVEMPRLGSLVLKHSGPFKAWVYAYDFTIIDLTTNKEQYYPLNQYVGSLNRTIRLQFSNNFTPAQYPIDDVPLPKWALEDIFLVIAFIANVIMLSTTQMPINCNIWKDVWAIALTSLLGGAMIFFIDWLLHYKLHWTYERNEYFNQHTCYCPGEIVTRSVLAVIILALGGLCIWQTLKITDIAEALVWLLVNVNSMTWVFGFWSVAKQTELGETIVALGLRLRGIDTVFVGMKYSEIVSDMHAKSNSASEDGSGPINSYISRSVGVHPSVKSFGFDPSSKISSRIDSSQLSGMKMPQPSKQARAMK